MMQVPKLSQLAGKNIAVWGGGREGLQALATIASRVPSARIALVDDAPGDDRTEIKLGNGNTVAVMVDRTKTGNALMVADLVVRSPGISAYHPLAIQLQAMGVQVTGSTALWFAETEGRGVVGITGTKGKSTTTALLDRMLLSLGETVEMGGNMGLPVFGWLEDQSAPKPDHWVVELSSFQLTDLTDSPDVGVVTSLFEDHTDWHGSREQYEHDKFNMFGHRADTVAVLNDHYATIHAAVEKFDVASKVKEIVWFDRPHVFHARETEVWYGDRCVVPADLNPLIGSHNARNIAAGLSVLDVLGHQPLNHLDVLLDAINTFEPLEHRLQTVSTARRLRWIDDGLSTNPQGAIAGIESFPGLDLTLLLGGFDRGVDYQPLAEALVDRPGTTRIILMPDNGPRIAENIQVALQSGISRGQLTMEPAESLQHAVQLASQSAPGSVVLLSPAAPSFGRFANYEERSAAFVAAIAALED